jgi:hypothetical protein
MKTSTSIVIKSSFEGFHCWPDAPQEVSFLRTLHRHIFKVELEFIVSHGNRQLEFFIMQRKLNSCLSVNLFNTMAQDKSMSCEQIGEFIGLHFENKGYAVLSVKVSEDGENHAIVRFDGHPPKALV